MTDFASIYSIFSQFSFLDLLALSWFIACNIGYSYITASRRLSSNNIINAQHAQRLAWMHNMAERDNRLIDIVIIQGFMQTNGFLATTCVFALGGLIAILGTGEAALQVLNNIPLVMKMPVVVFQIKLTLILVLMIVGFFKFMWAYRLANYATIAIGACPAIETGKKEQMRVQAKLAARLQNLAARHSYTGLRAYYFAIAALTWFIHPLALIVATTWVVLVLYRREYLSRSVRAIHAAVHKCEDSEDLKS